MALVTTLDLLCSGEESLYCRKELQICNLGQATSDPLSPQLPWTELSCSSKQTENRDFQRVDFKVPSSMPSCSCLHPALQNNFIKAVQLIWGRSEIISHVFISKSRIIWAPHTIPHASIFKNILQSYFQLMNGQCLTATDPNSSSISFSKDGHVTLYLQGNICAVRTLCSALCQPQGTTD